MAPNKFATMLNRNTNKISIILIYAVLEWILIALLLLNSLFSYLIIKFAECFGLKPPCLWCARLDHLFDPAKRGKILGKDLLCEAHSNEISKLGYCLNHQKLVESQEMCEDCFSSRPELNGFSKKFDFFSRVGDFGMIQMNGEKVCENGEVSVNCSCCGVCLDNGNTNNDTHSSYLFLKTPSWDVLEFTRKKDFALDDNHIQEKCDLDKKISDFAANLWDGEKVLEDSYAYELNSELDRSLKVAESEQTKTLKVEIYENKDIFMEMQEDEAILMEENSALIMKDKSVQVCVEEEAPIEISSPHLEFFLDHSGQRLVPIELIDSIEEHQSNDSFMIERHGTTKVQECGFDFGLQVQEEDEFVMETVRRIVEVDLYSDVDINEEPEPEFQGRPESVEIEETEELDVFHAKSFEEFTDFHVKQIPSKLACEFDQELEGAEGEKHSHATNASKDFSEMVTNGNEVDISIGTEIPDLDITDEMQNQGSIHSYEAEHHGPMQIEEQMVELKPLSVQETDHITNNRHSFYSELYEIEEDKVPDTPTSVDSLNHLHKKLLLLEKKEPGAEESLDGSVTSELENGDGVVTVERLKSALRAERKNLQALYAELEEERSASAVAANQTMAMINRLQEEKAAMQMEALQYQRMMDEQTEYDQEALELLNELMVKREKEKLELEKELEMCKKKVLEYEAKERMRISRRSIDGSVRSVYSSGSCSHSEDNDGLSIDLNQEVREEGLFSLQEFNTPVDAVANLEECLADFEEERFSILEQLKMLEEKLVAIDETEDSKQDNGNTDLHSNGCLMNGKNHPQRRIFVQTGKSLLPHFDATVEENDNEVPNGDTNMIDTYGMHNTCESKFGTDNNKVDIKEEVDHLYQRLQAFEADREFLKHCVSSLKKGDKGMDLLQEILQHLRDLRCVEFRARNLMEKVEI